MKLLAALTKPKLMRNERIAARLAIWKSCSARGARVERSTPTTPPNHAKIVELNERGELPDDPTELEAGANRCAIA